jgi:hypothetical protein
MARQRVLWNAAVLMALAAPLHGGTRPYISWRCGNSPASPVVPQPAREIIPGISPTHPRTAVLSLYHYIPEGDIRGFKVRLTEDFRFTSNDPGFAASFPLGFDRDDEVNFVKHFREAGHRAIIRFDKITAEPPYDPLVNPAGTFLVRVKGATMQILRGDGSSITAGPSEHVFEVVCVAVPASEGGLEGSRCYVRRWHEDASGILAAIADSADTSALVAESPGTNDLPKALDLRVLSNGKRDGLALSIALPTTSPARLEMFDITGRRIESRVLSDHGRGIHTIGVPAGLASGVYWARVHQAAVSRTARVVVVR